MMETRKHTRLKDYDYSQPGAYYITVCVKNRRSILSAIVGRGLAPAVPELSSYGMIVKEELFNLEKRYDYIKVDRYVIMPNHIHVILILGEKTAGASPRPTVCDAVCAWKSLSAARCRKQNLQGALWQTSFYDHVIRDEQDYIIRAEYIENNPARWAEDEYYS